MKLQAVERMPTKEGIKMFPGGPCPWDSKSDFLSFLRFWLHAVRHGIGRMVISGQPLRNSHTEVRVAPVHSRSLRPFWDPPLL